MKKLNKTYSDWNNLSEEDLKIILPERKIIDEPITYTEEEVRSLCNKSYNYGFQGGLYEHSGMQSYEHDCASFTKWFNNNKKK